MSANQNKQVKNNSSSDDEGRPIGPKPEHERHVQHENDDDKKIKNLYLLNPIAAEANSNNSKNYYCPSTPPQRATTNPPVNNKNNTKTSSFPEVPFLNDNNNNNTGYLLGNSPSSLANNSNKSSSSSSIPRQLDNKQIAELLRQQDPRFIRLVVPNENNNNVDENENNHNHNTNDDNVDAMYDNKNSESEDNKHQQRPVVTIYENPEQAHHQPTADELKQQQKIERIARHYGEQARDHGQQVPLIKPRYGPYRRNKESIRVSTNLTLGQQHNNASELFKSGGSFGVRPEKMVVQCGIQHYVDELHFDTPYAMFRTKDGKIETRSVGWSKRGDFVVERHDLILTSDYCYSDSDSTAAAAATAAFAGRRSDGKNNDNNIFGKIEKPKRLAEKSSENADRENNNNTDDNNEQQPQPRSPSLAASDPKMKTRKVLQVAHTFFDKPVCLDPVAPKPREVVSDGELRQASKNLWRRKYPGVRCPKNRKIRNRLMNDYFVTEHTRPMQLYHAKNKSNRNNDNNNNNNSDDDDEDDEDEDQFQSDAPINGSKKRSKRRNGKKIFSFTPESLPVGFVEFADKSEKQQQQIMDRLMKPTNENNFQPFSSGGGLQNNSTLQHQNKRPDSDSAEGRWNGLPQKHKQEISHALTRTDFMPGFVRDVEQQIRNFLKSWNDYYYFAQHQQKNDKNNADNDHGAVEVNKPEPYFDVLCRDGYGRLMVHILAQFYLLTSQSHDRVDDNNNDNNSNNKRGSTQNNNNNNNREFQRVTRVMLTSQKMKPPVVPMATLCALFMLMETPSLTPKTPPIGFAASVPPSVSPKNTFVNKSNNNSSKTGTPTTPGSGQTFSIGNAAIGTNVANSNINNNTKINNKDKNVIISSKKSADQNESAPTTTVVATSQNKNISPSSFAPSVNNRFGTLIGQGNKMNRNNNNNDDDDSSSSSSSDSDDEADGYDVDGNNIISSKQQKRFRKKKSLQFSGATRRAILPLLNGQ